MLKSLASAEEPTKFIQNIVKISSTGGFTKLIKEMGKTAKNFSHDELLLDKDAMLQDKRIFLNGNIWIKTANKINQTSDVTVGLLVGRVYKGTGT